MHTLFATKKIEEIEKPRITLALIKDLTNFNRLQCAIHKESFLSLGSVPVLQNNAQIESSSSSSFLE